MGKLEAKMGGVLKKIWWFGFDLLSAVVRRIGEPLQLPFLHH